MVASAAVRELTFIKQYMVKDEGLARQIAALRKEGRDRPRRAIEARQCDMRHEGPGFGGKSHAREQLIDLAMERGERCQRVDACPDHMGLPAPFEQAGPGDARSDRRGVQRAERGGDILGAMMIDLADEAQRQMKLVVILPARGRNAVHGGDQQGANGVRRA